MKKIKHSYFKDDIRKMLFLYAIIPVFSLTFVCLVIFWGSWKLSVEKTNHKDNQEITLDLETTVTSYISIIEKLVKQDNIMNHRISTSERVSIFEEIYGTANQLDRKANLYVFDEQLQPFIQGTNIIPSYLKSYGDWGIYRIMNQNPDKIAIKIVEDSDSDSMHLVIGKSILNGDEKCGYVIFVLDSKEFKVPIANLQSQIIITNNYGWVYTTNNYIFLDNLNRFALNNNKPKGNIEYKSSRYYVSYHAILEDQIFIYSISPLSNQTLVFRSIFIIITFIFVMMISLIFISTKKMALSKTKDLYKVIDGFEKVKEGDLNTYLELSNNDEFSVIAESYNIMIDSLKEQIETNKEMARLVNDSQTKQLESQFNTHFLYNTLENIRFMCKLDPDMASKMTFNLSTLLRYSISNTQEEVTVEEDAVYTENYMSILKYRFNRRFHYNIDVVSEVKELIIPKLIMQPLIENSIKYGFEGRDHLNIQISAYLEEDNLVISCWDDGVGMEEKVLEEVREILRQKRNRTNHFGLFNIHRRVQLRCGENYGVQIESNKGLGTYLKVVLPIRYGVTSGGSDA